GQLHDLSRGQRSPRGVSKQERQSRDGRLAFADGRGGRRSLRRDLRRQQSPRREGSNLQKAGQGRFVEEGRLRDGSRRIHGRFRGEAVIPSLRQLFERHDRPTDSWIACTSTSSTPFARL